MNRRNLLKLTSITGAGLLFYPQLTKARVWTSSFSYDPSQAEPYEEVREIADGVYFAKGKSQISENGEIKEIIPCNNSWILFDEYVLLIDSGFPAVGPALLREIHKTTDKPVRFVFNTHHHGDHIYGNRFWAKEGATIVAYAGLLEEMKKYETGLFSGEPGRWEKMAQKKMDLEAFPLLAPGVTFNNNMVFEDNNRRVTLFHPGIGHTKGDGMAFLEEEKILFSGDACLNGPYNKLQDAHVSSWMATLESLKRFHPEIIVPGHGDLGNESTIENQYQYFLLLYSWVKNEKERGLKWEDLNNKLNQLRERISNHKLANGYLTPEPPVMAGISLEAHAKKIYNEVSG